MAAKSGLYRNDKLRERKVKSQGWKELDWECSEKSIVESQALSPLDKV